MTKQKFIERHWRFYLMLERRFTETLQYVELDKRNFDTFSMEFASQIREIGSEIDIVFKELLGFSQGERKNINDYINGIEQKHEDMFDRKILVKDISITPFENLNKRKPSELEWWKAYNDIKHGRVANYQEANLKNVLMLLSVLYLLEMYLFKESITEDETDIVKKDSEIFRIDGWKNKYLPLNDMVASISNGTLEIKER